jgi:hypothetical protein
MPRIAGMRPAEQMAQAIYSRNIYNEINIAMRGIAGMYYCNDADTPPFHDYPAEEFIKVIQPLAIPQYVLRRGSFYPIDSPADIASAAYAKALPIPEILEQSIVPTAEQREYMSTYLTEVLTLAPRNAITSGYSRGTFAYQYHGLLSDSKNNFIAQHEKLTENPDNPSLQLYGAMALHAFAQAAEAAGDKHYAHQALRQASTVLPSDIFLKYKARILPTGNLSIVREDLEHYIEHETLPAYLGDH